MSRLHAAAVRASAVLVAAVLLCALTVAGSAYAWCPHMQRAQASCCAGKAQHDPQAQPSEPAPQVESGKCCETHDVDELPAAEQVSFSPLFAVAPAPLAGVAWPAAPAPSVAPLHAAPLRWRGGPIRAGPQSARGRRALLQIYLL